MRKGKLTFIRAKRCLTSSVSSACCQLAATLASKITHLGTWLVPTVLSSQSSEMLRIRKPITNIKPDEVEFRKDKPKDYPKVNANVWKLLVVTFSIFTLLLIITIQSPSSRNFFRSNTEQIASNDPFTRGKLYDAPLLDKDGKLYHLVFSTDCSAYQHWQSYLLFYSAWRTMQTGYVTRIASGCTEEEAKKELSWHNTHIGSSSAMSSRFRIHFTPHFSSVSKNGETVGDYKYFNKPFGLRHWMENDELIDLNKEDQDTIIILVDPDMILMRPITYDFSNDTETIVGKRASVDRKFKVSLGQPFAQTYGFGAHWMEKLNLEKIGGPDSPAIVLPKAVASVKYPVGPPYIAVMNDMYDIAVKWTEFAPRVHEQYPHLLAEMFAYCVAAAHLKLPHQTIDSLMVSNVDSTGEGWDLVDQIPDENICFIAHHPTNYSTHPVPNVIHYCQTYSFDGIVFDKTQIPEDFFKCDRQPLKTPNMTLLEDKTKLVKGPMNELKREGFMLCSIVAALNEALSFFCNDAHSRKK